MAQQLHRQGLIGAPGSLVANVTSKMVGRGALEVWGLLQLWLGIVTRESRQSEALTACGFKMLNFIAHVLGAGVD